MCSNCYSIAFALRWQTLVALCLLICQFMNIVIDSQDLQYVYLLHCNEPLREVQFGITWSVFIYCIKYDLFQFQSYVHQYWLNWERLDVFCLVYCLEMSFNRNDIQHCCMNNSCQYDFSSYILRKFLNFFTYLDWNVSLLSWMLNKAFIIHKTDNSSSHNFILWVFD